MRSPALLYPPTWPEADRTLWSGLITPALGPFDDDGALSHLRPASLDLIALSYGSWLAWLSRGAPEALQEPPAHRATPERLRAWIGSLTTLAPMSRALRLDGALRLLTAAAPEADWIPQRRLLAGLRREGFRNYGRRKQGRILSSEVLLQAGLDLAGARADAAASIQEAMTARRDGLMIAALALLPLRLTSFCTLELGRSVLRSTDGWVIAVEGNRMKAGRSWEGSLPPMLVEPFERYLEEVRPWLLARAGTSHDWLWVAHQGGCYKTTTLSGRIRILTERLTGVKVPPHFFRDAAATTLARLSPDAACLTRPLLAHADYRTADRHYVHAQGIEVGRDYATLIERLTKEAAE